MKKILFFILSTLFVFILSSCSFIQSATGIYRYNLTSTIDQGYPLTKVIVWKNPYYHSYRLYPSEQVIINSDFDDFIETIDFTWNNMNYKFTPDKNFENDYTHHYTVILLFNDSEDTDIGLHIFSDYVIQYGQPFFQLNMKLLGNLLDYLEQLEYEPFVIPVE